MKERWIHSIEVGFLIALLLLPSAAWAQSDDAKAKQLFKEAQTAYDLAEFDKALGLYSEAYRLKPLPGFLFNMAQCHRQKGAYERAAFFFQRFLDNSPPQAPNLEVAKELLAEMRAKQAGKSDVEPTAPPPPPSSGFSELKSPTVEALPAPLPAPPVARSPESAAKADAPVAAKAAPSAMTPSEGVTPTSAPALTGGPTPEQPVYLKGWFWGVVGLGVAVVVGGLVAVGAATTPKPRPTTLTDIGSNR